MSAEAETIFFKAREVVDLGERAALLEAACKHAPKLRRDVERMLADEGQAESFFTEEDRGDESGARTLLVQPAPDDMATEREGQTIGRYKLLQRIGEGGFGSVWMADQHPIRRQRLITKQ